MTDNKLTDNEIIKALECCIESDYCIKCPFENIADIRNCTSELSKNALDLINRLQAKVEEQQKTIDSFTDIGKLYSEIKAEAYKEFAEKLRKHYDEYDDYDNIYARHIRDDIDFLLEDLVGEDK